MTAEATPPPKDSRQTGIPRGRARPTKVAVALAVGAAALFGVGTNVGAGWVLAIAALLAGVGVVGAILPFRAVKRITVERTAPLRVGAGAPAHVTLTIGAGDRLAGPALVRDRYLGEGTAVVPYLTPGQHRVFSNTRTGARRGVHTSGPCDVVTGAPFGVVLVRRTIDVAGETIVYPHILEVPYDAVLGRSRASARAPSGDVSSVRDYRPGDPVRLIHWRTTAKRGELVVREFEDHDRTDLCVVADTPADPDACDAVASVACSFALAALREGREADLLATSGGSPVRIRAAAPETVLGWGARLDADPTTVERALRTLDGSDAVVCVLEPTARNADALHRLADLARSGSDVTAVLIAGGGTPDAAPFLRAAGVRTLTVDRTRDPDRWFETSRAC